MFVVLGLVATAWAGDALKPYVGRIVISPEVPPSAASELPAYLAANQVKENEYDLLKGPPWPMHLVGVLPKNVTKPIKLSELERLLTKWSPLRASGQTVTRAGAEAGTPTSS